jgi:hypothetical protein
MRPDHPLGVVLRRILDGLLAARLPAIAASLALRLAWIVLIVIALGCAGQGGRTASSTAELTGTWLGTFWQVNAGDTGYIHGDLVFDFKEDGSYTGTWTTRVVAGSSRGGSLQVGGHFAVEDDRVVLTDGRRLTLRRAGDTLYGISWIPAAGARSRSGWNGPAGPSSSRASRPSG